MADDDSLALPHPPTGKASRKQPVQYSGFYPPAPLNVKCEWAWDDVFTVEHVNVCRRHAH